MVFREKQWVGLRTWDLSLRVLGPGSVLQIGLRVFFKSETQGSSRLIEFKAKTV